jgi:hypothetical protein
MKTSKIGPVIAMCMTGMSAAGCLATSARPVKLTDVRTPSAPVSKIDLYYAGAVHAIETRDYARALDFLQTARDIAPDDVRVINAFGVIYDKLGRFDLSRRYYAQAKTLDPASKVVANNIAYSDRLQGLSREPLAFASAAEAEAKLRPNDGLMPGSPVVVVPIAAGTAQVVMVDTVPAAERAPELFGAPRRTQMAAVGAAASKPAAAQVARVEVSKSQPAAPAPIQVAAAAPKPARLTSAALKPLQIAQTTPQPAAAQVARVEVSRSQPAAPAPIQVAAAAPKPARLTSAALKPVLIAQTMPQPVAPKAPVVVPAKAPALVAAKAPAKAQPKLAGAPILLVDASGSPDAARRVVQRLTRLGWSIKAAPVSHGRPLAASSIDYPARTPLIAKALARTLPGAVRVHVCSGACPAIRLVVGRDALSWGQPKKVTLAWAQPKKTVGRS